LLSYSLLIGSCKYFGTSKVLFQISIYTIDTSSSTVHGKDTCWRIRVMYVERYQDTAQESKVRVFWISEKSLLRKRSNLQFIKLKYQKHFDLLLQLSKYSFWFSHLSHYSYTALPMGTMPVVVTWPVVQLFVYLSC
jgi:hypothetical protein